MQVSIFNEIILKLFCNIVPNRITKQATGIKSV